MSPLSSIDALHEGYSVRLAVILLMEFVIVQAMSTQRWFKDELLELFSVSKSDSVIAALAANLLSLLTDQPC
jgi:hypothetical protein